MRLDKKYKINKKTYTGSRKFYCIKKFAWDHFKV